MAANTFEIWRGPSEIDGAPLVLLVTGISPKGRANAKTGAMVQTYILRADMDPLEAINAGADVSICGACKHRGAASYKRGEYATRYAARSCYVRVFQAPLGIYRSWARGNVPAISPEALGESLEGRKVRLGSYGDPSAVPVPVWSALLAHAAGWTGYTHQAANPRLRGVLRWCQVSADTLEDAEAARGAGVGSFRVLADGESPAPFEMTCPASKEAGAVTTCLDCSLCSGMTGAHVAILAHGQGARKGDTPRPQFRRGLSLPVLAGGAA